jgi:hypothetical protein
MWIVTSRPVITAAAIIASAGILAGGLALRPAFAVGGSANIGPFTVVHCFSSSPCQEYSNQGTGIGVLGQTTNKSTTAVGVVGIATKGGTGVVGQSASGTGVNGYSVSGFGVAGTSTSTEAVFGQSSGGTAIEGVSNATNGNSGVAGISNATTGTGHGLYGRSSNGQGVFGSSSASNAIEGVSSANAYAGVAGLQLGTSNTTGGYGVYAEGADNTGSWAALAAYGDSAGTTLFFAQNKISGQNCSISYQAFLACTGPARFKSVQATHRTGNGQTVLAYGSESTSATIEDFGTAQMVAGVANVTIESRFGATIDRNARYFVFLTPLGDTKGLYVSEKTGSGFQVRETQGGRSTLSFDYRIVARPIDATGGRLPLAPANSRPR